MSDEACVIWTENGAWLQTVGAAGAMRLSDLGRLELGGLEAFCRRRGIACYVRGRRPGAILRGKAGKQEPCQTCQTR